MYDNTVTAREYIGYIAESASCFAFIGRDGKLYFRNLYQDKVELSIDLFGEYKWGEEFKISKVSYEDGTRSFKFGDDTNNNLWIDQDNVFIVDEEQIEKIYNNVKGLTINSFEGSSVIDPAIDIGDKIIIDGKTIVYQGEMALEGKFVVQINSKIQIKQKEETTVKKESQKSINRKVRSEIDQIDGKITQLVQEQSETESKLTQVEQTVDGISQRVEHMADVTNTATGIKILTLENCVAGPLLELHIFGNNNVFKHLYPSDDLLVSDDLIIYGDSRVEVHGFNGTSEESTFYDVYDLGITEVLRQNEEVCDEYILKDGKAQVIRRVNKDGTTRTEELIEELGEFVIPLKDVENVIKIQNYTASIETKYALKNNYTDIYATKVEMNSSITQTAEKINLEVSKKVDNEDFTSANIMLKINGDTSEARIEADKININGTVSANGNFRVDTNGNMECNNAKITGGKINLTSGTMVNPNFMIEGKGISASYAKNRIFSDSMQMSNGIQPLIALGLGTNANQQLYGNLHLETSGSSVTTDVNAEGITTPSLTQTSLESIKKNIEKFENGLDKVNNSDIYTYNLKSEKDTDKRHVGFIIGEKYKTPQEVIAKTGDGIDTYSMISILWKAVQELSNEIKELKEGK